MGSNRSGELSTNTICWREEVKNAQESFAAIHPRRRGHKRARHDDQRVYQGRGSR